MRKHGGLKRPRRVADAHLGTELFSQQLYALLKQDLVTCQIRPGFSLTESWVGKRYGASRTTVRDACLRLTKDELLGWVPNKGYFVADVSLQDLHELFELRGVLETAAVEFACVRHDPTLLAEAETLANASYETGDRESYLRFMEENHKFHSLIAKMSGNRRLFDNLDRVLVHFARFSYLTIAGTCGEDSVREHHGILDAIRRGDCAAARQEILSHMRLSKERAIRYFLK